MFLQDMHCDGCGQEAKELYEYRERRIMLLVCDNCWAHLHRPTDKQGLSIPEGCEQRFKFYRWLRLTGRISEGIEERAAA
jgi:hypothetical protein